MDQNNFWFVDLFIFLWAILTCRRGTLHFQEEQGFILLCLGDFQAALERFTAATEAAWKGFVFLLTNKPRNYKDPIWTSKPISMDHFCNRNTFSKHNYGILLP